jgi:Leucine-rich repeat (LRR) protein
MIPYKKNVNVNIEFEFFKKKEKKIFLINLGNEIEVTGNVRNLSPTLWTLSQLTVLYLNDNQLTRLPSEIACLVHLVILDLSNNKLRNLPSEIGMFI